MADNIYWAYVSFTNAPGGKKRPVLLIRTTRSSYVVLRITSKYKNKSKFFQSKYIEIKDWKETGLIKPSWIDTYQTYELPIKITKLEFIGQLTSFDLQELNKHFKF